MKVKHKYECKIAKRLFQSYAIHASDYTIEVHLTAQQTQNFRMYMTTYNTRGKSFGQAYSEALIQNVQALLYSLQEKKVGAASLAKMRQEMTKAGRAKWKDMFQIAICSFSYPNANIIEKLDLRGDAIRDNNPEEIIKQNEAV